MTSGKKVAGRNGLLTIYVEQGLAAARPLAVSVGINPFHLSQMARRAGMTSRRATELAKATRMISEMLSEFRVGREDLLVSKYPEHVKLRAKAIRRLRSAGLPVSRISEAMNVDKSTVRYWLCEKYREAVLTGFYRRLANEGRAA